MATGQGEPTTQSDGEPPAHIATGQGESARCTRSRSLAGGTPPVRGAAEHGARGVAQPPAWSGRRLRGEYDTSNGGRPQRQQGPSVGGADAGLLEPAQVSRRGTRRSRSAVSISNANGPSAVRTSRPSPPCAPRSAHRRAEQLQCHRTRRILLNEQVQADSSLGVQLHLHQAVGPGIAGVHGLTDQHHVASIDHHAVLVGIRNDEIGNHDPAALQPDVYRFQRGPRSGAPVLLRTWAAVVRSVQSLPTVGLGSGDVSVSGVGDLPVVPTSFSVGACRTKSAGGAVTVTGIPKSLNSMTLP
jgi:hypothetical protein